MRHAPAWVLRPHPAIHQDTSAACAAVARAAVARAVVACAAEALETAAAATTDAVTTAVATPLTLANRSTSGHLMQVRTCERLLAIATRWHLPSSLAAGASRRLLQGDPHVGASSRQLWNQHAAAPWHCWPLASSAASVAQRLQGCPYACSVGIVVWRPCRCVEKMGQRGGLTAVPGLARPPLQDMPPSWRTATLGWRSS